MSIPFNVREVLEMAMQIERNGREFYRLAAEKQENSEIRHQLNSLSQMEAIHEKLFHRMKQDAEKSAPVMYDPDDEAVMYIRSLVRGEVFDQTEPSRYFESDRALSDVLRKAIVLEKDSIVYYLGLREVVIDVAGRERVDEIVKEEQRHIRLLSDRLHAVSDGS